MIFSHGDHLGSASWITDYRGMPIQYMHYLPYGQLLANQRAAGYDERYKFTGKERDSETGYDYFGARYFWSAFGHWLSVDPLADKYPGISPYAYCAWNPIKNIDPDGRDWYLNSETNYYTWFSGSSEHENYTYYGPKGCLFGELESTVDKALKDRRLGGLFINGRTIDITPLDKGALVASKERDWDFLDEFCFNEGPEFSILLGNHPYTQQMMNDSKVIEVQKDVIGTQSFRCDRRKWTLLSVLNPRNWKMAPQFIGSYKYFGEPSKDGEHINNVIYDSKNVRSLFLHIPPSSWNKRRSEYQNRFGNTYQLYVWQSPK